jgi:signal transduction histidine kinase
VASRRDPVPPDTERRLADFTELVATAIANAQAQADLKASRARIVASADQTRRRIERDLHDGAQQRLVSLVLQLRAARAAIPAELGELAADLEQVTAGLVGALEELREFARGIHPAVLSEGGLGPALRTLARRSAVPVELQLRAAGRLPEPVEVAAYFVVSEALANAAKHAHASSVTVAAEAADGVLRVSVRDDGVGGADPTHGSGLVGLKDRVEALGGRVVLRSDPGAGTALTVDLPLAGYAATASG